MPPAEANSSFDKEHIRRVHRFLTFLSGVVLFAGGLAAAYVAFGYSGGPPRFLVWMSRLAVGAR